MYGGLEALVTKISQCLQWKDKVPINIFTNLNHSKHPSCIGLGSQVFSWTMQQLLQIITELPVTEPFSLYVSLDSVNSIAFLAKFFTRNGWSLIRDYWCTRSQESRGKDIDCAVFSLAWVGHFVLILQLKWKCLRNCWCWKASRPNASRAIITKPGVSYSVQVTVFSTFKDHQQVKTSPQRFWRSQQITAFQIL